MTVSPLYDSIDPHRWGLTRAYEQVKLGSHQTSFDAWLAPDGRNWFIDLPRFYARGSIYTQDPDEHLRFIVLTLAALELAARRQWAPHIAHANDWHTGLLPLYLRSTHRHHPNFVDTKSVFTIHNLAYQGVFDAAISSDIGLGEESYLLHQDHLNQGYVNFMEHALIYADRITTVSPTYAEEIKTPEMGHGLDPILRRRSRHLRGILNGIDTSTWNPATDPFLPAHYSVVDLEGKRANRKALLAEAELDPADVPLAGVVTRLTPQKGIELMIRPLAWLLEADRIRFVGIGTGEARYRDALNWLSDRYPERARFAAVYDERLAHLIEAGADTFLMPSRFEPSGLNQMYSLAYGTPPIVRRTGGLADTVHHFSPATGAGNGFVFDHFSEEGLAWALEEALQLYPDRQSWARLQRNGMEEDNSWERRAGEYLNLYEEVINQP